MSNVCRVLPGNRSESTAWEISCKGKMVRSAFASFLAASGTLLRGVLLGGFASRDVANLSGGEAQRVSFARALANSPEVLLLDEPTSALDDNSKREVEAVIRRISRERKIPCVLVTHDVSQGLRLAQWAMLLENCRIVRSGVAGEVLHA